MDFRGFYVRIQFRVREVMRFRNEDRTSKKIEGDGKERPFSPTEMGGRVRVGIQGAKLIELGNEGSIARRKRNQRALG